MAFRSLKVNGTRGAITPLASERRDLDLYGAGMERVFNWCVLRHGGFRRRSGTRYRGTTKANGTAHFYRFTFSNTQAYLFEFGSNYIRFWVTGGQLLSASVPYEIATPFTTDLDKFQLVEYRDVVYLTNPSYDPRVLTRTADTSWALSEFEFQDGPYLPINDVANKITFAVNPSLSGADDGSGGAFGNLDLFPQGGKADKIGTDLQHGEISTLTFDNTSNINGGSGFTSADEGRHIRFQSDGLYWWGIIDAVTSTTVIDVLCYQAPTGKFPDDFQYEQTVETLTWQLGLHTATNRPRAICWHEGRLIFGGYTEEPLGIAASVSGFPSRFSPADLDGTVTDDNGFYRVMTRGNSDPILWLVDKIRVQVGTSSSIRSFGSKNTDAVMSARNFHVQVDENIGSASAVPAQVGSSTTFVGRTGRTLHDLVLSEGRLQAPDISVLSEHLLKSGVDKLAWQQTPDKMLWGKTATGDLVGITFDRDEKVVAYHEHDVGGFIEDLEVIPGETRDELWLIVRRTVDSATVRYVETLDPLFDSQIHTQSEAFLVDSGGTYTGSATNTVTGATWLANEEVDLYVDGKPKPRVTVSGSGVITLPNGEEGEVISFGLPIANECTTLPVPQELPNGSRMGRRTRIYRVLVSVLDAVGLTVGAKGGILEELALRSASTPMGSAVPLLTGKREVSVEDTWDGDGQITFSVPTPTPATVRGFNIDIEVES